MERSKGKNPFRNPFLYCVVICCLVLSLVFFYMIYDSNKEMQDRYFQNKIEIVLDDFEVQLQTFEEMARKINIKNIYHPQTLNKSKYNENILLKDFEQYSEFSVLTEDCFLYYKGNNNIFHVMGNTVDLEVYLRTLSQENRQLLMKAMETEGDRKNILPVDKEIYILAPLKFYNSNVPEKVILGCVVDKDVLGERFQMVSGGLNGNISLYRNDVLLYCNQETACTAQTKDVLTAAIPGGEYIIYYKPEGYGLFSLERVLLQLLLILADMLLIVVIANIFAKKTYQPILDISDKYRGARALSEQTQYKNALEEIEDIIDSALKKSAFASRQVEQNREMLKRQILRMLLNGTYLFDMQSSLDKADIYLPGPFYYVISISFEGEENVKDDFLILLQKDLEELSTEDDGEYIYAVCGCEQKQLWVILSLAMCEKKKETEEYVREVAGSFSYEPSFGVGRVYESMSKISASWLESIDDLSERAGKQNKGGFIYESSDLHGIMEALSRGAKKEALEGLRRYTVNLEEMNLSVLMRQYVFVDFTSEIIGLGKSYRIELSKQNISLIIAAKNLESFQEAARELIGEFCDSYHLLLKARKNEEAVRICDYVKEHFREYDLSIEKVAADLNTTTSMVRDSIYELTGKMYRDYISYLRVECARKLLLEDKMAVSEACEKVGYSSVSHFIKVFKKTTGVTPAKYIKEKGL